MPLHHFPTLAPDELLYSGIARYACMDGLASSRITTQAVLGAANRAVTWDLPTHLDDVSAAIHRAADDLIDGHTLWPYYARCLPTLRGLELRQSMRTGHDVHAAIGVTASSVLATQRLRYCKVCAESDLALWGAMYWHRAHQCPGVAVCSIHRLPLIESDVEVAARSNKHHAVALAAIFRRDAPPLEIVDAPYEFAIARRTSAMLFDKSAPELVDRLQSYHHAFRCAGWETVGGRIRWKDAIESLQAHMPEALWLRLGVRTDLEHPSHWLMYLLRAPRRALHPLFHILAELLLADAATSVGAAAPSIGAAEIAGWRPSLVPSARKTQDRAAWQRMSRDHSQVGPKRMRLAAPALYARLYRHSREWLKAWNVKHRTPRSGITDARKDWAARDAQLAHSVVTSAAKLKSGPCALHRRISRALLLRSAGVPGMHSTQLAKLPALSKQLSELAESRDAYVARRLRMTVGEMKDGPDARPASWRVLRAGNIRWPWLPQHQVLADQVLRTPPRNTPQPSNRKIADEVEGMESGRSNGNATRRRQLT